MSKQHYMQQALDLAARGEGRTSPNPPVGSIVVRNGEIVGRGFHPEAGQPHAEIFALREAAEKAAGAELYVTLEPCNHKGRTGPCSEAIIAAGISRVVVGTLDPNPRVAGAGIRRLQNAGISVETGVLEKECRYLIAPFAKHIVSGLPHITLKMAMTLDGQTATSTGDSQWITNEESRQHVHRMRDRVDAIMVGVGTVLADNPKLTTRLPDGGKDPVRIVVDSKLRTPDSADLFTVESTAPTLIVTTRFADSEKRARLEALGAEVVCVDDKLDRVDLKAMMIEIGRRGIQSILLEGGATLASESLHCGIVDRAAIFIAPKLFGGGDGKGLLNGQGCRNLSDAIQLQDVRTQTFSGDILIEGEII